MRFLKESIGRYRGLPKEIYILFFARVINNVGAFVHPLLTLMMTDRIGLSETKTGFYMMMLALIEVWPRMSCYSKSALLAKLASCLETDCGP